MRSMLNLRIAAPALLFALFGFTTPSASAAITAFFVPNPISQAAIAADPALANMQSWSLMATNTDGHWASAGVRLTLPAGNVYYQTPLTRGGGDTHPNPALFALFPESEFDTYVSSARNQLGQNPPAILGPYPENDPPLSFGGATDPVPGRFSVSWGDPQATSGPGSGTYEILRITFPRSVSTPVGFVQTSQIAPDQTIGYEIPWPEPAATGLFLVLAAATARPRHH
jgi:hypothetical protein